MQEVSEFDFPAMGRKFAGYISTWGLLANAGQPNMDASQFKDSFAEYKLAIDNDMEDMRKGFLRAVAATPSSALSQLHAAGHDMAYSEECQQQCAHGDSEEWPGDCHAAVLTGTRAVWTQMLSLLVAFEALANQLETMRALVQAIYDRNSWAQDYDKEAWETSLDFVREDLKKVKVNLPKIRDSCSQLYNQTCSGSYNDPHRRCNYPELNIFGPCGMSWSNGGGKGWAILWSTSGGETCVHELEKWTSSPNVTKPKYTTGSFERECMAECLVGVYEVRARNEACASSTCRKHMLVEAWQ